MTNSRNKGASAERELFKLISDSLGVKVERNLIQTRDGGCDTSVNGWAIEVKRVEKPLFDAWWAQAIEQAVRANCRPMLFYRKSRHPWRCRVLSSDYTFLHGCTTKPPADVILDIDLAEAMRLITGEPK